MLHYSNIVENPFPDVRDPVTGEWLPRSYNDMKADSMRKAEDKFMKSNTKAIAGMLSSILK